MGKLQTSGFGRTRSRLTVPASVSLSQAIIALSPVGYWKLNDTSGTSAVDSSGNGRNGTYTTSGGGVSGYTLGGMAGPGVTGNYVYLSPSTAVGFIEIADNNAWSIDTAPGLTVFACIKPDSVASGDKFILAKGTTAQFEYGWVINNNSLGGRIALVTWSLIGNTIRRDDSDNAEVTTNWQAVAFYSASPTSTSTIELRRNSNTELSPVTKQGFVNTYANGTSTLMLGFRTDLPGATYWDGGMAHVALFAGNVNLATVFAAAQREGWY